MERRKFLTILGAGAIASVAGCTSEDSDPEDRETGTTDSDGPAEAPADSDDTGDSDGNSADDSGDTDDSQTGTADGDGSEDEQQVEVLTHEWYEEEYSAGVQGEIENVSGETLSYVEVSVYFLDSEGRQIGDSLANTSDLAPGRVWAFDVMYLGSDADQVENYEIETDVSNF